MAGSGSTSGSAAPAPNSGGGVNAALSKAAQQWGQAAVQAGAVAYDPRKFYTRATDLRGHGEKIGGKVTPDIHAQVQELCFDPIFPDYATPMDVVRDGLVHIIHLRSAQRNDPRLKEQTAEVLRRIAYEEFTIRMADELKRWSELFERTRDSLTQFLRDEAWGQLGAYLDEAEDYIHDCAEPYRTKIRELLAEFRARIPRQHNVQGD